MRRMLRWGFGGLTTVSLVLFVIVSVVWPRSDHAVDWLVYRRSGGGRYCHLSVRSWPGAIQFACSIDEVADDESMARPTLRLRSSPPDGDWDDYYPRGGNRVPRRFGLHRAIALFDKVTFDVGPVGSEGLSYATDGHVFIVPCWVMLVLFGVLPLMPLVSAIRRLRRHKSVGTCQHCGYDLRATPERCPECGNSQESETGS